MGVEYKKYLERKVQGFVLECELPSTGRQARATGMCCNAVGVYFKYSHGGAAAAPADYSTWCGYVTVCRRVRVTCGWQEQRVERIEIGETEGLMQRKRQVSSSRVSWHAWLCVMRPRTRLVGEHLKLQSGRRGTSTGNIA